MIAAGLIIAGLGVLVAGVGYTRANRKWASVDETFYRALWFGDVGVAVALVGGVLLIIGVAL